MVENVFDIHKISTCELVKELETREGVQTTWLEPYQNETFTVEGPAIIFTVID